MKWETQYDEQVIPAWYLGESLAGLGDGELLILAPNGVHGNGSVSTFASSRKERDLPPPPKDKPVIKEAPTLVVPAPDHREYLPGKEGEAFGVPSRATADTPSLSVFFEDDRLQAPVDDMESMSKEPQWNLSDSAKISKDLQPKVSTSNTRDRIRREAHGRQIHVKRRPVQVEYLAPRSSAAISNSTLTPSETLPAIQRRDGGQSGRSQNRSARTNDDEMIKEETIKPFITRIKKRAAELTDNTGTQTEVKSPERPEYKESAEVGTRDWHRGFQDAQPENVTASMLQRFSTRVPELETPKKKHEGVQRYNK
jgi:hypothetical protein